MTPEGLDRLRSHADAIARAAHAPASDISGLVEEMLGHLVEVVEHSLAAGADEDDAIPFAIAAFGGPEMVGRELARTYHSELWTATVGVLLAPRSDERAQPGPIGGLRLVVALLFAFTLALGVVDVANLTPLSALLLGLASGGFLVSAALAFRGLGLGQRWALHAGLGLAALAVVAGVLQVAASPAGTTTIPLLAIGAGLVLMWAALDSIRIDAFVTGSRPIGAVLGSVMAVALIAPSLVSAAIPAIHDPTQAGPGDVAMTISMTCRIGPDQPTGDSQVDARPVATLTAELAWSRADLLPRGLAGLINHDDADDTAGFRVIEPPPTPIEGGGEIPPWLLDGDGPIVIDAQSGETVGWFGSSSPSVERIPETMGSFTVGIDTDRIRAGHTTRIVWSLSQTQDGEPAWPRVEVAYAHLDRFVLIGSVGCGKRAAATADTEPAPVQSRFLP